MHLIAFMAIIVIGTLSCNKKKETSSKTTVKSEVSSLKTINIEPLKINDITIAPKIHFNNLGASVINKKIENNDPCACFLDENDVLLLKTTIDTTKKGIYTLYFGIGMSLDPHFSIFSNDSLIGVIEGVELSIPGNGTLYSNGHTNNLYNEFRAWKLTSNKLEEIKQPLQYVGLKTVALSDFAIHADTLQQSTVATIAKGDSIELLVQQNHFFLIRNSYNLVGWWKIDDPLKSKQVNNLFYLGD